MTLILIIPIFKVFFLHDYWLDFSLQVLIDSFLSEGGSSNWSSLNFEQATEFSWYAENAEKCYFYCYFVDSQTHNFLKLSTWFLPTRSQSTTFLFVENFVKIFFVCSINHFYTPLTENIAVRLRILFKIRGNRKLVGNSANLFFLYMRTSVEMLRLKNGTPPKSVSNGVLLLCWRWSFTKFRSELWILTIWI